MDTIQFIFLAILFSLVGVYIVISIINYYNLKKLKELMTKSVDLCSTKEEVNNFKKYSESSLYDAWQANLLSITTYYKLTYHIELICQKKNMTFDKD
jgi:hypothetical protein